MKTTKILLQYTLKLQNQCKQWLLSSWFVSKTTNSGTRGVIIISKDQPKRIMGDFDYFFFTNSLFREFISLFREFISLFREFIYLNREIDWIVYLENWIVYLENWILYLENWFLYLDNSIFYLDKYRHPDFSI